LIELRGLETPGVPEKRIRGEKGGECGSLWPFAKLGTVSVKKKQKSLKNWGR